jgi:hypothetical protein
MFDKTFYSAIATSWRQFEDGIALQQQRCTIPDPKMMVEQIGDILNLLPNLSNDNSLQDQEDQIVDDGDNPHPRPQRHRRATRRLSFDIHQADREWNELGTHMPGYGTDSGMCD